MADIKITRRNEKSNLQARVAGAKGAVGGFASQRLPHRYVSAAANESAMLGVGIGPTSCCGAV